MTFALIVGATSAIAEATARLLAARAATLYLVGRNSNRLDAIAADLRIRGAQAVYTAALDLNAMEQHEAMLNQALEKLGRIDLVLIAHGTLSDQSACEASAELAVKEITTNALSTIALLTRIANIMERQQLGTIAVISSVAGDRGRASNYIYGSAKALVTAFLSGLRQKHHHRGIAVITIKPGFVDTPMTADFSKNALWAQPTKIAKGIIEAIDRRCDVVYLPRFWALIMLAIRIMPERIFKRLRI